MRIENKKPLTENACKRLVSKLRKLGEKNANAILDQSSDHYWQDVYPLRDEPEKTGGNAGW